MMKVVASPYHQKLKFPSIEGIVVVFSKEKDARHCFGLVVQSALMEKRAAELTRSLLVEGKKSKKERADEIKALQVIVDQSEEGKRKEEETSTSQPETSQKKGKATKNK